MKARRLALVARDHPERSIRIFLPFQLEPGWEMKLYYPEAQRVGSKKRGFDIDYGRYLPLMHIPVEPYGDGTALGEALDGWRPDFTLVNQPLDLGRPDTTGFLYHGIPWEVGRSELLAKSKKWDRFCRFHLASEPTFASELVAGGVSANRVMVPGLTHNDYLLTLDRPAMREAFLGKRGLSERTTVILFAGNVWRGVAETKDHYTILGWLEDYATHHRDVMVIVKPKTLGFRARHSVERVLWADSAPMLYDYFFADVLVSMPVGTQLADACVCDIPVVMCETRPGSDEVEAIEHGIGTVARSREGLAETIDDMLANPQLHAAGRMRYLDRLYPQGLDGQTWRRVLDCVEATLEKRRCEWSVDRMGTNHVA